MFFILNLPAVLIAFLKEKDYSNFVGNTLGIIRGHRPNYSLGGKILANREGDYESFFREGEENYKPGYGTGMGRKFLLANFLCKIRGRKKKILKFLLYVPKNSNFSAFLKSQGGGSSYFFSFRPIGWYQNYLRVGDCVFGGQPMGIPPPSPPPRPPMIVTSLHPYDTPFH